MIRLHGPWSAEVLCQYDHSGRLLDSEVEPFRIKIPGDWDAWVGAGFGGRIRLTRKFNCPTGLNEKQQVLLALESVQLAIEVVLNNKPLAKIGPGDAATRMEIRAFLQPANLLTLEIENPLSASVKRAANFSPRANGLIQNVRLEIANDS